MHRPDKRYVIRFAQRNIFSVIDHSSQLTDSAIDKTNDDIQAWAHIDRESALQQAQAMDLRRQNGKTLESLHAMPIGLKDIIDTGSMPTQYGTPIYANRQPDSNAAIVDVARDGLQRAPTRTADDYAEAQEVMNAANDWFETFFHDYDAIIYTSSSDK